MMSKPCDSALLEGLAPALLRVRLAALAANYRAGAARAGTAKVAPVVKADAYGLGMAPVARKLMAEGADTFFVARVEEGIALRVVLPKARIFVLDGAQPGTAPALVAHRLIPVLNAMDELEEWSARSASENRRLEASLQIDTGMNRSGLPYWEVAQVAAQARTALENVDLVLILSHLGCADEPGHAMNATQLERFRVALAQLPHAPASLAASAGIELGQAYRFDMVRPGIGLYGGNPVPARANPYASVAALTGRVLQVRRVGPKETVGYGGTFTVARPTVIAIAAIGYSNGLVRAAGAIGSAAIAGVRVPFAGRISMDLATLDVTDLTPDAVAPGTEVEFLGETVTLDEMANAAGTIAHEVLTSIGPRARRIYLEE